jgi:ribonuclease HI
VSGHFKILLQALVQALALSLPDLTRSLFFYVSERQGFALGVLGHNIGPSFAPVAYLSKQLDPTTRGWAPCFRALAAASLLIQESQKLTFGFPLTVYSSHSLSELLTYQELHSCPKILEELLPCPDHIQEGTLSQADYTWFIDGSSFIHNGQQRAGYAIVSNSTVLEAHPLPLGTTSQKPKLIALARALTLAKNKTINIYTNSKNAFHTLLSHSANWKERELLTTKGTPINNAALITQVLKASRLPSQIGITHSKAHQTDSSIVTKGNN